MSNTTQQNETSPAPSLLALLPLGIFLALFIGVGSYLTMQGVDFAFYQLPAPVAALPAVIVAILLSKENSIKPLSNLSVVLAMAILLRCV